MRLPLSQLRRILCEADVGTKELVNELIDALNEAYKDDEDASDMKPFVADITASEDGYIIDVYHDYDRPIDKDTARLHNVIKSAFWLYAGDEPVTHKTQPVHGNNFVHTYMVTNEYVVKVQDYDWAGGGLTIEVQPKDVNESVLHESMTESAKSKRAFYLMPEIKAELVGYLGNTFGNDKVKVVYDGAVNLSINVEQPIDDATMQDVRDEVAGLLQMYTGEEASIDSKISWSITGGNIYVVGTRLFMAHIVAVDFGFNVHVGPDR